MSASIVAGCEAAPILDPAERVFDAIALPAVVFVIVGRLFALRLVGCKVKSLYLSMHFGTSGIITAIGQQLLGLEQAFD